ncbi:MAG TPA: EF-Tu/IF-2/RF-3 family GTPase [Armatimonadota bacterium]|nr:EF-Tu/IF-2/RF-3 family GTPase [Armatimonadota bacterium]
MEVYIGRVSHYFTHLAVAGVKVESEVLKVGDTIHIQGHTTDLIQTVDSMQLEHEEIQEAKPGMDIGIKVRDHVREHDRVLKVVKE